jgi:hypothetical protein
MRAILVRFIHLIPKNRDISAFNGAMMAMNIPGVLLKDLLALFTSHDDLMLAQQFMVW